MPFTKSQEKNNYYYNKLKNLISSKDEMPVFEYEQRLLKLRKCMSKGIACQNEETHEPINLIAQANCIILKS